MKDPDIFEIAKKIHAKIAELENLRESILPASTQKATDNSNYERELALTIVKLKNGAINDFEGIEIPSPCPVTLIKDIAKGICFKESFKKEDSDGAYKGLITIIDSVKAELNGLQSLNKNLE